MKNYCYVKRDDDKFYFYIQIVEIKITDLNVLFKEKNDIHILFIHV